MKCRLRTIVLFGLLGLIVNICIAWAFAVAGSLGVSQYWIASQDTGSVQLVDWPISMPGAWPKPTYRDFSVGRGIRFDHALGNDQTSAGRRNYQLFSARFGWPCYSMQWQDGRVFNNEGIEIESVGKRSITLPDWVEQWASMSTTGFNARRRLPVDLILPGILINTVFFGSGLWLILRARRDLRIWWRRRHGGCVACGYPIGMSPFCTECGATVNSLSAETQT